MGWYIRFLSSVIKSLVCVRGKVRVELLIEVWLLRSWFKME
jgi:hypothetical protein